MPPYKVRKPKREGRKSKEGGKRGGGGHINRLPLNSYRITHVHHRILSRFLTRGRTHERPCGGGVCVPIQRSCLKSSERVAVYSYACKEVGRGHDQATSCRCGSGYLRRACRHRPPHFKTCPVCGAALRAPSYRSSSARRAAGSFGFSDATHVRAVSSFNARLWLSEYPSGIPIDHRYSLVATPNSRGTDSSPTPCQAGLGSGRTVPITAILEAWWAFISSILRSCWFARFARLDSWSSTTARETS